jgi:hypothetical protein
MRRKPAFVQLEHILNTYPQRVMMMTLEGMLLPVLDMFLEGTKKNVPWPSRLRAGESIFKMYTELRNEIASKDKDFNIRWQKIEGNNLALPAPSRTDVSARVDSTMEGTEVRPSLGEGAVRRDGGNQEVPGVDVPAERPVASTATPNDDSGANVRSDKPTVDRAPEFFASFGGSGSSKESTPGREESLPVAPTTS